MFVVLGPQFVGKKIPTMRDITQGTRAIVYVAWCLIFKKVCGAGPVSLMGREAKEAAAAAAAAETADRAGGRKQRTAAGAEGRCEEGREQERGRRRENRRRQSSSKRSRESCISRTRQLGLLRGGNVQIRKKNI